MGKLDRYVLAIAATGAPTIDLPAYFTPSPSVLSTQPASQPHIYITPAVSRESVPELRDAASFIHALGKLSTEVPREDGMTHPIDSLLDMLIAERPRDAIPWLQQACRELLKEPATLANLLHGIAVQSRERIGDAGLYVAVSGLLHPAPLVRDAATRVLESWHASELADHLRHASTREPVQWLASYMAQVATEIA